MSLSGLDNEFLFALRTSGEKRNARELNVIYSRLRRLEPLSNIGEHKLRVLCALVRYESYQANQILYRKDDACRCWYILMSGSVFIQGSMFLPFNTFGKQIPGTKRRGCQCLVLEPSEMIAIDYPDMAIHTGGGIQTRPHALRHSTTSGSQSTLDSVVEADTSSSEGSPRRQSRSSSLHKGSNGQVIMMTDTESQSSLSKDMDDDDYQDQDLDEEDSISLHSTSSIFIKDLVIEVLKKEIVDRNADDLEILLEFTKSLKAFSNMTEPTRRALCKVMVFAWVATANTVVLKDNEQLDSWSVIINGQVVVKYNDEEKFLEMGDSFGVEPTMQPQSHKGVMTTTYDDCQFLCIAQDEYYDVVHQGQENIFSICDESGEVVMVKERRDFDHGTKKGNIVIRGNADSLLNHLLEENAIDPTYTEDFLLTYRAFGNEPLKICTKLLDWFDQSMFRDKVIRIILLWVNNHFNDFECDWKMMAILEKFEEKLNKRNLYGETKLFNIACMAKAKPRAVSMNRASCDVELGFEILGGSEQQYPIYISTVIEGSVAETKGVKRGDQLLEVNGQNFEKISFENAQALIKKNTDLALTLKTNLFAFKEMVAEMNDPDRRLERKAGERLCGSLRGPRNSSTISSNSSDEVFDGKHKKGGTLGRSAYNKLKRMFKKENNYSDFYSKHGGDSQVTVDDTFLTVPQRTFFPGSFATIEGSTRSLPHVPSLSLSSPDLLDSPHPDLLPVAEAPEDVIKVYRADQSSRFLFVSRDTTAGDAVQMACKDFGITEDVENYALYRVTVQGEKFVKQSKLPNPLSKLSDIPLGARYYLKKPLNSEQLLPDENIPDLLKEANFSFLDLNCFEVALYLTREDYKKFQLTEPTNFIDDLFHLQTELGKFKEFEDLVNQELFWVVTTICEEASAIQRSKIIKHFIKISQHCKILKNFNSTFALISGLGYRAVSKMKQSWEKVPAKSVRQFEELQGLMDPSRNMSKYRTLLNEFIHQPPVIPYVPVVKKDLTFLHLGNDTKVEGLINFEKMRMIAKEVRNICRLCAPDKAQIIPSAAAAQQRDEKGAIYQTLARRGRRASFNNARRMYEDQMNVRRVRQYMKQRQIITDEDELMEMSKIAEPQAGASGQPKRRHTTSALNMESPSRSSKTLPNSGRNSTSGSTGSLSSSRNNSEPHLNTAGIKKKIPTSTLPKYSIGPQSPQLISRKLMSLSEESGDDPKHKGKKGKDSKRSASVSSQDYSPVSSPFTSPKHTVSKPQHADINYTVAMENTNRNNNRRSLPTGASVVAASDNSSLGPANLMPNKRFSGSNNSNPSSCRSSIASASSLGTVSSSNPSSSSLGGSNSPCSSSPVPWGSSGSLSNTTAASPRLLHQQLKGSSSPVRSSSGSSTDTITGNRHGHRERPVIKQTRNGRSSSFGGGSMLMSSLIDRNLPQMSSSTSSPTLHAPQAALILPNHPRIPRTPSVDSGVVSAGSISADSTRFNLADENEIFARHFPHPSHAPPTHPSNHRHHQNRHTDSHGSHEHIHRSQGSLDAPSATRSQPPSNQDGSGNNEDKVEQTFLSGYRGQRDPPLFQNTDPFPTNLPPSNVNVHVDRGKFAGDGVLYQAHIPPGMVASQPTRQIVARNMMGKSAVKGIHEFVCERHAALHSYRANANNNNSYNPVMLPNYMKHSRTSTSSSTSMIEEQLVLELQKQKLRGQKPKPRNVPTYESPPNLVDIRRLSLSKSDPSLNNFPESVGFPCPVDGPGMNSPSFTSSPKSRVYPQRSFEDGSYSSLRKSISSSGQYHSYIDPDVVTNPQNPACNISPLVTGLPTYTSTSARPRNLPLSEHTAIHVHSKSWSFEAHENVHHKTSSSDMLLQTKLQMTPVDERHVYQQQRNRTFNGTSHADQTMTNGVAEMYSTQRTACDVADGIGFHPSDASHQYIETPARVSPHDYRSNAVDVPAGHVLVQQTHYVPVQHKADLRQHRRKTSQEWTETDLDGDKQQSNPTWDSGTLQGTPISSKMAASTHISNTQPSNPQARTNPPAVDAKTTKPPPPAPPTRKSSIGRPQQLRLSSTSSPSPPRSPSPPPEFGDGNLNDEMCSNNLEVNSNGYLAQQHSTSFSVATACDQSSNYDRRSLPTYTEAVHRINAKQNSRFPKPAAGSYRSFSMDCHDNNQEQISQV